MPNKPSIIEIINETEKNSARLQTLPLVPNAVETSKAIMDVGHGHPGIAEPLTWHQLESEMAAVDQSLRDSSTSTSKDGISTWILLSGSEKQKPSSTPASTTVAGQVDKLEVQNLPSISSERHNYRFEPINQDKLTKPLKNRPEKKSKPTTPAPASASSISPILLASDFIAASKLANRRKHPVAQVKVNKRKPVATLTTTTTTTTTTTPEPTTTTSTTAFESPDMLSDKNDVESNANALVERTEEIEVVTAPITTTPYPFIVLEPKDADFDLPQDRSPTTKKPKRNNSKAKRKNGQKNKTATPSTTAVSKVPANKDKPISTKIYNYLSREVMSTVGVGLMGLVVSAGLASYFFGPLTALRRSYDDALDRQDNVDNIYQVNSEEYATNGAEGGQNEEEIFGKFIAGMPASNVPKYVRYYKPEQSAPYHGNAYNTQRRVYGQQIAPKYNGPNPYVRYRTEPNNNGFQKNAPSPHFNPAQYHPQHVALRNHQPISPVYDPRYHETPEQKSFANKMDQILNQSPTYTAGIGEQTVQIHEKSTAADILADETPQIEEKHAGTVLDDDVDNDGSNKIQRRTNTYVVGTALSDIRPDETIVSASMTAASADDMLATDQNQNEPVAAAITAVTAASHGPRRRRRRSAAIVEETKPATTEKISVETTAIPDASTSSTTQTTYISRVYDRNDIKLLEVEFSRLQMKIAASDNGSDVEKKIQKKIQTEYDRIESDIVAFKKAIDAVQPIEMYQKQLKIRAKNYELSVALRTGITQIRQRIKLLVELIEHPDDDRIVQKINRRDGTTISGSETSNGTTTSERSPIDTDERENNGFIGFLKLLQLKAQFGLNILKTIKPSFERAFEEVFKRPLKED